MPEYRILLVDESETVRDLFAFVLAEAGFAVETAGDSLEAVRTAFRTLPDLVMMDIAMSGVSGAQACRILKDDPSTREIPVVLIGSREGGVERLRATRTGADRFLPKESTPAEVVGAVRESLKGLDPRPPSPDRPGRIPEDREILFRLTRLLESRLFVATLFNEVGEVGLAGGETMDAEAFEGTIRAMDRYLDGIAPHDALAAVFSDGVLAECVIVYPVPLDERLRNATREMTERLREREGVRSAPGNVKVSEFHVGSREGKRSPQPDLYRPRVVCPVRSRDGVRGLIALFSDDGAATLAASGAADGGVAAPGTDRLVESLLRHGFLMMENTWLYRQIHRMSVTDGLTGLINQRHFRELLAKEHSRATRYRLPYSLMMADIDHFKKINDVYGHPVGDAVIREMAGTITGLVRGTDITARYGGEEFVVLLPETPAGVALTVANRVREVVERKVFASPSPLVRCTVSVGLAAFTPDNPARDADIVARADEALYDAKRQGRNRVVCR